MSILLAMLLLAVSATCSIGPGFYLLRRLRWSTDERLCASIALSLILAYLIATAIYLLHLPWSVCWIWTGLSAAALFASRRELRRILRKSHARRQIGAFGFLLLLGALLLSLIQHYSGGQWYADWLVHYQRAIFFLEFQPNPAPLFGGDVIPSRPPFMNILAAFLLAHTRGDFDLFQIVFLFLNLLVFFPCVLLAGLVVRFGNRRVWTIAALLALNPMVLQNATFTWTKLLAAFFVMVCLALYLRGWQLNDHRRMIGAALCMAAATLVHYSALPYALPLAVHFLFILRSRSLKSVELFVGGGAAVALLLTWFGWSIAIYGLHGTFHSNTSVLDSESLTLGQNLEKVGKNIVATLIPHPLRINAHDFKLEFEQPSRFGWIRDYFFHLYQTNLPFSFGSIGAISIGWLTLRHLRRAPKPQRWFWIWMIGCAVILGIAATGTYDAYGLSQICLQTITLLGLMLLAGGFRSQPRWLQIILILGLVVDAILGIMVNFRVQAHAMGTVIPNGLAIMDVQAATLNIRAVMNAKIQSEFNLSFWSTHFAAIRVPIQIIIVAMLATALVGIARLGGSKWRSYAVVGATAITCLLIGAIACEFHDLSSSAISPPPDASNSVSDARFFVGFRGYEKGRLDESLEGLTDAYLLDPENPRNRYMLYLLLLPNGRLLSSTDAGPAEDFLHSPDDPLALQNLAKALRSRGFAQEATRRLAQTRTKN